MIDISSMTDAKMCEMCNRCVRGIFRNGIWVTMPSTTVKYGGYFCGYTCSKKFNTLKELEEKNGVLHVLNKR